MFDNKVVVLTGATGFLGRNFSKMFVEEGAILVVADISKHACDDFCVELNNIGAEGKAYSFAVDLTDETSVIEWAKLILSEFGEVDVLVNNAATKSPNMFEPLESFPLEDWNLVMGVNITGMFLTCRELGTSMAYQGKGCIVNLSSIYGVVAPDQRIYEGSFHEQFGNFSTPAVYSVSKFAVIGLTKYLATYWGGMGVRSNTLTPGGIEFGHNEEFVRRYSDRVPLGKMGKPQDLCGALKYLASDESSYVNGQNIIVDGGLTTW